MFLLRMPRRKRAQITAIGTPTIAIVEGLVVVAMNVGTRMLDHPRLDYLGTRKALGSLGIFCILKASMLPSKRSFDGLRFCLDFTYTRRAHRATRMWFSTSLSAINQGGKQ